MTLLNANLQVVERYGVVVELAALQSPVLQLTSPQIGHQLQGQAATTREPDARPSKVPVLNAAPIRFTPERHLSPPGMAELMQVACRFVYPVPSTAEVLTTLNQRAAYLCQTDNIREIAIYCSILFATERGRSLLFDALRLDLSAELLGFLVDCESLRSVAEEWLPRVMILADELPPQIALGPSGSLCSQFYSLLNVIVAEYVDFSAPHYISMCTSISSVLRQAFRDLGPLQGRVAHNEIGDEAAAAAIAEVVVSTVCRAELDVFEMIIDPLCQHMKNNCGVFDSWAADMRRGLCTQGSQEVGGGL